MQRDTTTTVRPTKLLWQTRRTLFIIATVWTVSLALLLYGQIDERREDVVATAKLAATQLIEKDLTYRLWAAKHNGVYVPVTEETPPNPYLVDIEHRDVTTTDGQRLTLVNPAYMTRQVHKMELELFGRQGHLTSLSPLRPENVPDAWEASSLRALAQGAAEVFEIVRVEDVEYLRLIKPVRNEEPCLKCHAKQGHKLGEMRGGLSTAIPLAQLRAAMTAQINNQSAAFGLIWLLGLCGLYLAGRQIEQRQRLREQVDVVVSENEKNLRQTLNSIGEGLIRTDQEGLVMHMNPVSEKLTGWQQKDAGGRRLSEIFKLIHLKTRQAVTDPLGTALLVPAEEAKSPDSTILVSLDGTEYRISYSTSPIKAPDGSLSGAVVVFQNMTEQIQLQEKLLKARDFGNIALLAGGIAHEFNNLFTGLFGNIQLATLRLAKDHPAHASLVAATNAFSEATNLTQQLMSFAKGGAPILEILNLETVLQHAMALGIKEQNIKIIQTLQDDLWQINGDEGQLAQMLSQLFINAVQSMPEGGSLYIEAKNINGIKADHAPGLSGDFVVITVRDEGSGIPEDEVPRVFDLFYTTKPESRGLGLAIAHRIVTKHNGHISLYSRVGEGTTVTVYLPAQSSADDPSSAIPASSPGKTRGASGHVLVMDDEEMVRNISKDLLKTWGYQVDTAVDGEEALEKFISADNRGNPFDVVIMDLFVAKGVGGDIAIKKLLALYPEAKVIVTSGYFSNAIMANFNAYGFKGRLAKPYQMDVMQKEVSRVINL